MQTLQQIQTAVGEWSEKNFGGQETPFIAVHEGGPKKGTAMLGSLAPLMGVAEELGELAGARNDHDRRDALGDILIYFCDYGAREKFVLPWGS